MKRRTLGEVLDRAGETFPAIVVTGPRQAGKTTLLQNKYASSHSYVNLENLDVRQRAKVDPIAFLDSLGKKGVVLDEIQQVPELLSYIKTKIDENRVPNRWILSGSQNFLLMKGVTESLAGRAAVLSLLPFSVGEACGYSRGLTCSELLEVDPTSFGPRNGGLADAFQTVWRGSYPEVESNSRVDKQIWAESYISTYLERDIRNLRQVGDLGMFQLFLQACAARTGQILDLSSVASDIGVSFSTAKRWLSLLETGYQVQLVYPYYQNIGKRLVKRPKMYFTDTGLASYLMGVVEAKNLAAAPVWGPLFETFVVMDFWKRFVHHGQRPAMYYLRTRDGLEIDLLLELNGKLNLIEIKGAATILPEQGRGLRLLRKQLGGVVNQTWIISNSPGSFTVEGVHNFSWRDILPK